MRLRTQLLLAGLLTALVCGLLGSWVLGRQAAQSARNLLDGQLYIGEQAFRKQWTLHHAQRQSLYESVTKQPFLRAYLSVSDREQMHYFAELVRQKGADTVAIIDRQGAVLAMVGPAASVLASRISNRTWPIEGDFVVINGAMFDAVRLPIGVDKTVGYLLVGHQVTEAALREYTDGFGVSAVLATPELCISTLPKSVPVSGRGLLHPDGMELETIRIQYHTRLVGMGSATLLLAIPLTQVRQFVASFLPQIAAVFLLVLVAVGMVSLLVMERVTKPIESIKLAADNIGSGHFQTSRARLRRFSHRTDELGGLSRALDAAAKQLTGIVASCQDLTDALLAAVSAMDRSATTVADGATNQKERLLAVKVALDPLLSEMDKKTQAVAQLGGAMLGLSMGVTSLEHTIIQSMGGTRSRGPSARQAQVDQQEALAKVRECVLSVKSCLDVIVETQVREQHQGKFIGTATAEIGRIASMHADAAHLLRTSAVGLRGDINHLQRLLSKMDVKRSK